MMLFLYVIFVFKVYFFSHTPEIKHLNLLIYINLQYTQRTKPGRRHKLDLYIYQRTTPLAISTTALLFQVGATGWTYIYTQRTTPLAVQYTTVYIQIQPLAPTWNRKAIVLIASGVVLYVYIQIQPVTPTWNRRVVVLNCYCCGPLCIMYIILSLTLFHVGGEKFLPPPSVFVE